MRAHLRRSHTFRPGNGPNELSDEKAGRWQVREERLEGPEGERLARAPGLLAYWFGWHSFHPRTELYHEVLPPALQPGRP